MTLSKDQENALKLMETGRNIFLTGEAGTGKSYLLEYYIQKLKDRKTNVLVCAPTGIAAINIGGATLHKTFQVSLTPQVDNRVGGIPKVLKAAEVIIIDEISMCRLDLFDKVMRTIALAEAKRKRNIQIILVGDFYQLPPVVTNKDREILEQIYPNSEKFYAFESSHWKDRDFQIVNLKEMMRQDDPILIKQLNKARKGDTDCISFFNQRIRQKPLKDGITLCATNREAIKINDESIDNLKGKAYIFKAAVTGDFPKNTYPTPEKIKVKKGMRVMSTMNGPGYQNGSLGTITDIDKEYRWVRVEFDDGYETQIDKHLWENVEYTLVKKYDNLGNEFNKVETKEIGTYFQLPLKPAYAVTMHKSQGQTFDKVNLIPFAFTPGQLYVALSRVRTLTGLCLLNRINSDFLIADKAVTHFYSHYGIEYKWGVRADLIQHYIQLGTILNKLNDSDLIAIKDENTYKKINDIKNIIYETENE